MSSTIALLFDYLVSTKIGYAIIAFIGILLFYAIFIISLKIIDYLLFKKLTKKILDAIYNDSNEGYANENSDEDKDTQRRDKKLEQQREFEKKQNMENDIHNNQSKNKKKIIGFAKPIGKWTNHAVRKWMKENRNVDMGLASDVGYFQAKFLADQEKQDLGGQIGGR